MQSTEARNIFSAEEENTLSSSTFATLTTARVKTGQPGYPQAIIARSNLALFETCLRLNSSKCLWVCERLELPSPPVKRIPIVGER